MYPLISYLFESFPVFSSLSAILTQKQRNFNKYIQHIILIHLNKYLSKMTPEQSRCVEDLVSAYAKSCGINYINKPLFFKSESLCYANLLKIFCNNLQSSCHFHKDISHLVGFFHFELNRPLIS